MTPQINISSYSRRFAVALNREVRLTCVVGNEIHIIEPITAEEIEEAYLQSVDDRDAAEPSIMGLGLFEPATHDREGNLIASTIECFGLYDQWMKYLGKMMGFEPVESEAPGHWMESSMLESNAVREELEKILLAHVQDRVQELADTEREIQAQVALIMSTSAGESLEQAETRANAVRSGLRAVENGLDTLH